MGNAKDLQRIEETRIKVQKSTEDHDILPKEDLVEIAGEMENRTPEDRKHMKDLIKCYWAHTTQAHEEAAAAASILKILVDKLDEQTYMALIMAGTRPLIMVEVPQMARQVTEMRPQREWEEKAESLSNQPIEEVIASQNVPVPILQWSESNIMLPMQYLAAMGYYFVAAEVDSTRTVTNKGVAAMFKLAPSNLHKLVSGKKYAEGSKGEGRKVSSLKELEERSKKMCFQCGGQFQERRQSGQGEVFGKGENDQNVAEAYSTTIFRCKKPRVKEPEVLGRSRKGMKQRKSE